MDVLTYYLDDTAPAIRRRLSIQGEGDLDIVAGPTFRIRIRPLWSDVMVVDAAMTVDITFDEVSYQPLSTDFDAEGVYRAWITVDYGAGLVQNTDEFQINVFAHGPGQGTPVGEIYRAARALEPVVWDSLRNYRDYGDVELQRVIELAKLRVLPEPVAASDEATIDPRVVDYIAKKVLADNILSAAISFWSDQVIAQTARGNTEEVVTYPDRIKAAESSILRYRGDLARQLIEVDALIGATGTLPDAPMINDSGPLLTPGLDEYPALPITLPNYWRRVRR
jgi:hypothetical protein